MSLRTVRIGVLAGVMGLVGVAAAIPSRATEDPLWLRRAGTAEEDGAWRVATDAAGNAVVAGWTTGALFGAYHGSDDVWLAKYGSNGRRIWARQFGSVDTDQVGGVATDRKGDIYLAGQTSGDLFGPNRSADLTDGWVAKYGADGVRRWARQFGSAGADDARGIAVDGEGRIFVAGTTSGALAGPGFGDADGWLGRLDPAGRFLWRRPVGTAAEDGIAAVALEPNGDVVVAGSTLGSLGGPNRGRDDAWIGRYDANGRLRWLKQIGTAYWDSADCLATDRAGNLLVAGYAERPWLAKYDGAGHLRWRRDLGSSNSDAARTIATDATGAVYLAVFAVAGEPGAVKYDRAGQLVARRRLLAADDDMAFALALDRWRNVLLVGGLALSPDGYRDAWVAKFAPM